jgi:hypothetical protein
MSGSVSDDISTYNLTNQRWHIPSISLKLLPILGVPSLVFVPCLLGLSLANSARCLGLRGPGPTLGGLGASLAELANEELASRTSCLAICSRLMFLTCVALWAWLWVGCFCLSIDVICKACFVLPAIVEAALRA